MTTLHRKWFDTDLSTILTIASDGELTVLKSIDTDLSTILTIASDSELTVDDSNGPVLDPMVWSDMPAHLLETVFKRVPFTSLMRFRTLSTDWNSVITSPKFTRDFQMQEFPKPVPIVLCISQNAGGPHDEYLQLLTVFNPNTYSWESLWVPPPITTEEERLEFRLIACSGALTCFSTHFRYFVVCNSLTGTFRCLEVPYPVNGNWRNVRYPYVFADLVADHDARTFKLVVVNLAAVAIESRTLVYNSEDDFWRSCAPVPRCYLGCSDVINVLTLKESVYFLVKRSNWMAFVLWGMPEDSLQCTVLKYDVRNDSWLAASLESGQGYASVLKLVEYQSQVLLMAKMKPSKQTVLFRVEETADGRKMELVENISAFPDVKRAYNSSGYDEYLYDIWAGDVKYSVPSGAKIKDAIVTVERFNCSTREQLSVLPPLSIPFERGILGHILVLETSATTDL